MYYKHDGAGKSQIAEDSCKSIHANHLHRHWATYSQHDQGMMNDNVKLASCHHIEQGNPKSPQISILCISSLWNKVCLKAEKVGPFPMTWKSLMVCSCNMDYQIHGSGSAGCIASHHAFHHASSDSNYTSSKSMVYHQMSSLDIDSTNDQ